MLVLWSLPQCLGPPLSNLPDERQGNARGRHASVRPPATSGQHAPSWYRSIPRRRVPAQQPWPGRVWPRATRGYAPISALAVRELLLARRLRGLCGHWLGRRRLLRCRLVCADESDVKLHARAAQFQAHLAPRGSLQQLVHLIELFPRNGLATDLQPRKRQPRTLEPSLHGRSAHAGAAMPAVSCTLRDV